MAMLKDLAKIPLFASIPESELIRLAEIIEVRTYAKGEVLFWEGEPAQGLFLIKRGAVQISKTNYQGKQAILHIFGSGEVLAEAVIFSQAPYPATAEAVVPSTVYFMDTRAMQDLMLRHPRIALYIIEVLSTRLRIAQDKIKTWSYATAEGRTAKLLLDLARLHGREADGSIEVAVDLPQARLAALTGLTRETVSRVLSAWRSEDIIDTKQKRIFIKDLERIKEFGKE
jgi:CRP/FNR family cyclic AMP-dependent transcriptional regulator